MLGSKNISRSITASLFIFALPISVSAGHVSQDLKSCASSAIADRQQTAKAISVIDSGLKKSQLDHGTSSKWSEYKMLITGKTSGTILGTVSCKISKTGELISASFDS